jgi:hypothetical protein
VVVDDQHGCHEENSCRDVVRFLEHSGIRLQVGLSEALHDTTIPEVW